MNKQLIGFLLSGHDNESYMLGDETRKALTPEERKFFDWRFIKGGKQHPATCPKCGRKTDPNYIDPSFQLRKKKMDVSSTYDGYTIVSEKFKKLCESRSITGIDFTVLPSQPGHYRFVANNVIEVDTTKSLGIRLLYYCDLCKKHAGVFGTGNLRFKGIASPMTHGIYRTDLEFAQAHEQQAAIVVGIEVATAMKTAGLKGLCLSKVEYA